LVCLREYQQTEHHPPSPLHRALLPFPPPPNHPTFHEVSSSRTVPVNASSWWNAMSCNTVPEVEQAASVLDTRWSWRRHSHAFEIRWRSCMHVDLESQAYRVHEGTYNWFHMGFPLVIAWYVALNIPGITLEWMGTELLNCLDSIGNWLHVRGLLKFPQKKRYLPW